jgi:hypothetical protein
MGAHSTLLVTRAKARQLIKSHIPQFNKVVELQRYQSLLQDDPELLCSETLASIMGVLLDDRLYNCVIIPDYLTENDDDYVESLLNN